MNVNETVTATYFVDTRDFNEYFNSYLKSHPCDTKEAAIKMAIDFSYRCGYALLYETVNNKMTCTFLVQGRVQGINSVGI